jgi:hypothetical protein
MIAVALAAVMLTVAATASAERWVSYRVTVEGEGAYTYDRPTSNGAIHHDAQWTWRTEIPIVAFEGDTPHTQSAENAGATTSAELLSGDSTRTFGSEVVQCTPTGISAANSGRFLPPSPIPDPNPTIGLRVLGGVFPDFEGCPGQAATQFAVQGVLLDEVHSFDTWFSIPREAIGMGRIIQLVHEEVTGNRCPNNLFGGADCRLTFDATVTFDKFDEFDSPGPPSPPDDSQITEDDIPTPPARKGVTVKAANATLSSAAKAELLVTCPAECSGTVTATLPHRRGAAATKLRALAHRRFTVPAGRTKRVVLRFPPAARRKILRARRVSLRVRTVSAGKVTERVLSLRLKGSA